MSAENRDCCARCGNQCPEGQGCDTCKRIWHAYIDHMESVHAVDVVADTAAQAAVIAARQTGIAGRWTVVQGSPLNVTIEERRDYWPADVKWVAR